MTACMQRLGRRSLVVLGVLAAAALVAGCSARSTADNTTHYLLTDKPMATVTGGGEQLLRVQRIELARYLDGDGLVMQTSDIAIRAARNHLWAEDLAAQLQRDLRRRLSLRLDEVRVLGPDERVDAPERAVRELSVMVHRFQGRYDGYAVVGGEWQLLDEAGEVHAGSRFRRETPLARDGYPALVASLNQAWTSVVDDIADSVRGSWPDAPSH